MIKKIVNRLLEVMTNKKNIKHESHNVQNEIKALTKFLIDHFDPKNTYEDQLMAECGERCSELRKLEKFLIHKTGNERTALLGDELTKSWVKFGEILTVSPDYIEAQYVQFIKK